MVLVEYKLIENIDTNEKNTPEFIEDGGHFYSLINDTLVGWVQENTEIPNTALILTKESFITRNLNLHEQYPMVKVLDLILLDNEQAEPEYLTSEEVVSYSENWYDNYVNKV